MNSKSIRVDESNAATAVKAWIYHCRYLSRFALSQRDDALKELESFRVLPGLMPLLELDYLFDLCSLANQFSLWDLIEKPLKKLERISREQGYSLGLAQAGFLRAALSINEGKYQEAIDHYHRALASARNAGDSDLEAEILNDIGFCYRRLGDNEKGEENYLRSLEIRRGIGNLMGTAESLSNLGLLYADTRRVSEAEEQLARALQIETIIGDKMGAGYTLVNLGFLYKNKGDRIKAKELLLRALEIRTEIGDYLGLGYCNLQLAHIMEDARQAEGLAEDAFRYFSEAGDINGQLEARMTTAEILMNAGETARAAEVMEGISDRMRVCSGRPSLQRYMKLADRCRKAVPESKGGTG